jgi:DNA polymerase-3 subunit beta
VIGLNGGISVTLAGVLEMGVDREFLLEALDAGGSSQLVLELDGPIAPLAIRGPDRAGDVSMLMPIRLP